MIAACPKCQTRYRVEPERLGADGARLRCSHCSAVFRVRLPAASHAEAVAPVEPTPRPEPSPANQGTPEASDLASEAAASGAVARSPQGAEGGASEGRPGPRSVEPPNLEAPHFDHSRLVLVAQAGYDAIRAVVRRPGQPPVLVLALEAVLESVYRSGLRGSSRPRASGA